MVGERLMGGEYRPLQMHNEADGTVWTLSAALGLDLVWQDG